MTRSAGMRAARGRHTATLLANGQVLVTGGTGANGDSLVSAELFDPASGSFTRTGDMGSARYLHTATLLNDGTVLVAGGAVTATLSTAEIYQ